MWRVDFQLKRTDLDGLEALLSSEGFDAFEIQDAETFAGAEGGIAPGEVRVVLYPDGEASAHQVVTHIRNAMPGVAAYSAPFEDQEWTEVWKRFIPAAVIRERVVFRPPFRPSPMPGLPEVVIDPGLAFGTGSHETTRLACGLALDAMDALRASNPDFKKAADIGCGTGVIAAALIRCGCPEVDACDVDVEAIDVAREVLEENGLSQYVNLFRGTVDVMPEQYPLVVANILADKILMIAEGIHRLSLPGGEIVLSGILKNEVSEFLEEFMKFCPVTLVETEYDGEWAALRLNHVS